MSKKSTQPFKVGIVGAGQIAEFHIRGIQRFTKASVVGIADTNLDNAQAMAKRHKISERRVYASLTEMLEREKPDIVHICTPPGSHLSCALQALEAGCHLYVEKPLTIDFNDCTKIEETARRVGRLVCVGHSMLRDPFVEKALAMVKAGKIGKVLSVDHFRSQEFPPYSGGNLPERCRSGGFPFWDVGVHSLYLFAALLGEIKDEKTMLGQPGDNNNPRIKDWYSLFQCENGVAHLWMTWNALALQNVLYIHGTRGTIRADIFGMNVTCRPKRNKIPGIAERLMNAGLESVSTAWQLFTVPFKLVSKRLLQNHGIQVLIGDFYHAIEAKQESPVRIADAKNVIQWTETVAKHGDAANDEFLKQFPRNSGEATTLITGATGFIGHHLLDRLLRERDKVRILVRKVPPKAVWDNPKVEVFLGDIGDKDSVDAAMKGIKEVFHLGAVISGWLEEFQCGTITGTQNMIDAALENNVGQFVYMSSLSVLQTAAVKKGDIVREDWQYEPYPERRGGYTLSKLTAEKMVLDAVKNRNLPAVLLRPGEVVGADRPFMSGAAAIEAAGRFVFFGWKGDADIPVIWMSDLIDAVVSAANKKITDGSVFNIVERVKMTQNDVVRAYCETTGKKDGVFRRIYLPMWFVKSGAWCAEKVFGLLGKNSPLTPYRLDSAIGPRDFDCSKAERELDWKITTGVYKGLKETSFRD